MNENKIQQDEPQQHKPIKPDILDYDDIRKMVPFFDGKPKLVKWLFHLFDMDDANWIHGHNCHTPGVPFCTGVLKDLNATITYDNGEVLDNLPEGAFITVTNHPFGAVDGVMMIHIIGTHRPDYKFMVNMMLSKIGGMMPNFITVDALASDDPAKRAVINSMYISTEELTDHTNVLQACYREIEKNEVMFENYRTEDAEIVLTAFGTVSRVARSAVDELREEGYKVGLFRPITVWPFPYDELKKVVNQPQVKAVLDIEVNEGQMLEDVNLAVSGARPVEFLGHCGSLFPTTEEVKARILAMLKEGK